MREGLCDADQRTCHAARVRCSGDTMIRYGQRQTNFIGLDSVGNLTLVPFTLRAETRHNFQFSAGVGLGSLAPVR